MDDRLLWYVTRGAGLVSLVLLTLVVVLGVLARMRLRSARWPSFLSAAVHRDVALLSLVFLGLHIVTAVVDPFTSLGWSAVVVPFSAQYRTVWLGLGTIALELLLAVIITSLMRRAMGERRWRAVHWLAYAAWPVALAHGVGTGTDSLSPWAGSLTITCLVTVLAATGWRWWVGPVDPLESERRAGTWAAKGPPG